MEEGLTVFEAMRMVMFLTSPILFWVGVVMVLHGNYSQLEEQLKVEVGGIKKKLVPVLENDIYTLHTRMIPRRTLIGLLCVIFSLVMFFTLK